MNKTQKILSIGITAFVVVAFVIGISVKSTNAGASFWAGIQNLVAEKIGNKIMDEVPDLSSDGLSLGAVASPDIMSPYISVGGVRTWYSAMNFKTATTTLCSMKNPAGATTTLKSFSYHILTGTSTPTAGTILVVATSTLPQATSTTDVLVAETTIAADARGDLYWTIPTVLTNEGIMGKDDYILLQVASSTAGSFHVTRGVGLTGYCKATFQQL